MSATPPQVQGPVPEAGAHTAEVLTQVVGMPAEVAELAAAGVVGLAAEGSGGRYPLDPLPAKL